LETVKKLFPLRTCNTVFPLKKPQRPCINYEIGRCPAPCAGHCTVEEYRETVDRVIAFLGGSDTEILNALKMEMNAAARNYKYERAAVLRDKIRDIEGMMQRQQAIQTRRPEQDVIALYQDDMDAMAQVLMIRDGKMIGGSAFELPGEGREDKSQVLFDFVLQYYDERKPAREVLIEAMPDEITEDLEAWLNTKSEGKTHLLIPQRGDKRALVLLAQKNARDALEKRNAQKQIRYERSIGACKDLAQAIGMKTYPRRIEGYDISNTQGQLSVASMVVFIDGDPAKNEYRRYRIKTVEGANDFASLNEVLLRRFKRAMSEDPHEKWPMPDLVLIDGGPEQLAFAREAMLSTGANVPMFGLAKKREEIFLPDRAEPILLDHHTPALHLIQRVRDESHRFAITFHRSLRGKAAVHSKLEDINGVGPERRKALIAQFGSIKALTLATEEEIASVKGIPQSVASAVYSALHSNDHPS
ncbi:MAG: excinuclease ABC subunit UvrC, partial [Clostridia bacterium]|nr:excinuclease ABC subunit UvrC [Clostridia bacterium]